VQFNKDEAFEDEPAPDPVGAGAGKVWLRMSDRIWVVDTIQKKTLWSTEVGGLLDDDGLPGPIVRENDSLVVTGGHTIRKYKLETGKPVTSEEFAGKLCAPPSVAATHAVGFLMKSLGSSFYSVATIHSPVGEKGVKLSETLFRVETTGGVRVTTIPLVAQQVDDASRLKFDSEIFFKTSDENDLAVDSDVGFVLLSKQKLAPGTPSLVEKPFRQAKSIIGHTHHLYCFSLEKMRTVWKADFESPGGRLSPDQGVCCNSKFVFAGSGNIYIFDRLNGRPLPALDLDGKLVAAAVHDDLLIVATKDGRVLAFAIDNP
jgi:hypothetical protein